MTWTSVSVNPGYTITESEGSGTKTVVNTVWNQNSCKKAKPVSSWSNVSTTLLVGYSICVLFWILNIILGNDGHDLLAVHVGEFNSSTPSLDFLDCCMFQLRYEVRGLQFLVWRQY